MGRYLIGLKGERSYQQAIARTDAGETISLLPEPDNPHDPRAVVARNRRGETIGYLERGSWLSDMIIDEGKIPLATVNAVTGGEPGRPTRGVVLQVLTGADAASAESAGASAVAGVNSSGGTMALQAWRELGCVGQGLTLFALFAVLGYVTGGPSAPEGGAELSGPAAIDPAPAPELTAAVVKQCSATLDAAARAGVIRDRPSAARIDVDELAWADLAMAQKRELVQAVACVAFRRSLPPSRSYVVVYGWRDGARKMLLTSAGFG